MAIASAYALSDYSENNFLAWVRGTAFPTAPTTVYVGLLTTVTTIDTGTTGAVLSATDGVEVSWTNYARQSVAFSAIGVAAGDTTGQQISNTAIIGGNTAWTNGSGSAVSVAGVAFYDALTGGHELAYVLFGSPQTVNNGTAVQFNASTLSLIVD